MFTVQTARVAGWLVLLFLVLPQHALAAPFCGNGKAEKRERCDGADLRGQTCQTLGYDLGTLECTSTCTLDASDCHDVPPPVCGDGEVNQDTEECDGADFTGLTCQAFGYDAGTMACDATCGFVLSGCFDLPVCGDGSVNTATEECDGADLGGLTCTDVGYDGGTLACDAGCLYDETGCTTAPPLPVECGNGVVDGAYEECDGTDDTACPDACSAHCACPATSATGDLEVHVVDVGQGDGIVVVSPEGFVMVLDAGTNAQAATIETYLQAIGLTAVDYTLVSHLHADHLGGMDGLLLAHPEVTASFDNGRTATTGEYLQYEAAVGTRRTALLPGDFIDLGPSVAAEVLHADQGSANENNNSIVLRLTYGSVRFLLGGDCESGCESTFDPGPISVYKVHHHGSAGASTDALLTRMQPDAAVISVGANNAYGHPTTAALDRLAATGASVWRTDLDGDVEIVAGPDWYLVNGTSMCLDGQTRACGVTDVGACALGVETCTNGTWQPCVGNVDPVTETCGDAFDDDCDGLADFEDPSCGPAGSPVVIAQVYYDTLGTDSIEEFVDLHNRSAAPVALGGWTLSDNGGTWTIPPGTTIAAGGFVTLARDDAGFQAHFGFLPDADGMTLSLANTADGVILRDGAGVEADRVAWEGYEVGWTIAASTGNSIARTNPGIDTDGPSDWSTRVPAAPLGGF